MFGYRGEGSLVKKKESHSLKRNDQVTQRSWQRSCSGYGFVRRGCRFIGGRDDDDFGDGEGVD